jgi:hypothetical protein
MYVDLRRYDVVLTTSFLSTHGISGHTFEMIEYYLGIKQFTSLRPCILLSDGTTLADFEKALSKYVLDDLSILEDVVEHARPKIVFAKHLLIVDGSFRMNGADVFAEKVFLLRCAEDDFSYFNEKFKKTFLLQDFDMYEERYQDLDRVEVLNYKKKILFSKLRQYEKSAKNTAMLYLTTNCRAKGVDDVNTILNKYGFTKKIILTNKPELFDEDAYRVPVDDLWEKFSTYIYTSISRMLDCSPRFIAECAFYGKEVIYDIDYFDPGLTTRRRDLEQHGIDCIALTGDDMLFGLLQNECK